MLFNKKIVLSILTILALVSFAFTANPYLSRQKHDKDPRPATVSTSSKDQDITTRLDRDTNKSTELHESSEGTEVRESSEGSEESEVSESSESEENEGTADDDDTSTSSSTTVTTLNTILPAEAEADNDGDDMTLSVTPQQADTIATQKVGAGSTVSSTILQGQETNTPFFVVTVMNNGTATKVDVNATNGTIMQ